MKPLARIVVALLALPALWTPAVQGTPQAQAQTQTLFAPNLYGIVGLGGGGTPYHPRHLIRINTATGAATVLGHGVNGINVPEGLAYNPDDKQLYAIDESTGRILTVDPASGSATGVLADSGSTVSPMAIAYRWVDQSLYVCHTTDLGLQRLHRLDRASGASIADVGPLGPAPVQGLSARPSDGTLYGATTNGDLVTIATTPGLDLPSLVRPVAHLHRVTRALAFHPDGTLYATDGAHLFTINPETGADSLIGSFGDNINTVAGLAFVPKAEPPPFPGPRPVAPGESRDPWGRAEYPGILLLAALVIGAFLWWRSRA
jgi:hypothetical protein